LEPIDFFSQYALPHRRVGIVEVLSEDAPRDKSVIIVHEDQPVFIPIELLNRSEAIMLLVDPVVSNKGVVVGECGGNPQAALSKSDPDGFITETICRFGCRPEDVEEVEFVKIPKHSLLTPSDSYPEYVLNAFLHYRKYLV
jgi:hypothetical protein